MTPTAQREDIATVRSLIVSGALPVHLLTEIEVRHEQGCPLKVSARNLVCWCHPVVYVRGQRIEQVAA